MHRRPGPVAHRRVVLIGFMGAGKTTVGRLLASRLNWRFHDADALLVERSGLSIAQLFAASGEAHFRQLEASAVAELLHTEQTVIALGGGAVEASATRSLLSEDDATLVVYLETPFQVSLERCARDRESAVRPVLDDAAGLERRFQARVPLYQIAELTVPTERQSPVALSETIAMAVRSPSQETA